MSNLLIATVLGGVAVIAFLLGVIAVSPMWVGYLRARRKLRDLDAAYGPLNGWTWACMKRALNVGHDPKENNG